MSIIKNNSFGFTLSSGKYIEAEGLVLGLPIIAPEDDLCFDPRREPAYTGSRNQIHGGSSGGSMSGGSYEQFTDAERREIAAYMALRWLEWGDTPIAMLGVVRLERLGVSSEHELRENIRIAATDNDWDECNRLESILERFPK